MKRPQAAPQIEIPLTRGFVAIIDAADEGAIGGYAWRVDVRKRTAYAATTVRRADGSYTSMLMHSLLTGWPMVDHANGNGLDNRRGNLRQATVSQNGANTLKRAGCQSRFKGVARSGKRWRAYITVAGRQRHLGSFVDETAAAQAYDAAARRAFGPFALLNFPVVSS